MQLKILISLAKPFHICASNRVRKTPNSRKVLRYMINPKAVLVIATVHRDFDRDRGIDGADDSGRNMDEVGVSSISAFVVRRTPCHLRERINVPKSFIHHGQASIPPVKALGQLFIVWVENVVNEAEVVFDLLVAFHAGASFGLCDRCLHIRHLDVISLKIFISYD